MGEKDLVTKDARQNQNFDSEFSNKKFKTYITIVKENLKDVTDEVFELLVSYCQTTDRRLPALIG